MGWAKGRLRSVPRSTSRQVTLEINDYSRGMNDHLSNDKMKVEDGGANTWRLAQDARIVTLGEYETRKGFDFYSEAAGVTKDANQESTTGAADKSFSETTWLAQAFTTSSAGRLTKLDIRIKNASSATGVIKVEVWSDDSGPATLLSESSISASTPTSSYAYITARFAHPYLLSSSTTYWIVIYIQPSGSGSYSWSSTSSATNARISTDSGTSWSSTSYALNFKQYYATNGAPKGLARPTKSDGSQVTLFAHDTTLYSVDDVTGALTSVKTGLSSGSTHYRFSTVNNITYYVNGQDGFRKLTGAGFSTDAQVNATNYTLICEHKGLLFLVERDDPNKLVFSNFADYETFTSTDFIYVPSPKTGDPITALVPLNGYLMIFTRNNKYILSGDDNATFRLDEAPDQKGTYTQETTAWDKNYAYYISDDGVYQTNGSESKLISKSNLDDVRDLPNKENSVICVSKGRLYVWYTQPGESSNSRCWVYNLNYGTGDSTVLESIDTEAYVARALNAFNDDDELLVASSIVGQAHWQGRDSNDYSNLGSPLNYILQTHYLTLGSPAVLKQIRQWNPRFKAQDGDYKINIEYAYDLRDNWTLLVDPDVQGAGPIWGSGILWGAFTWGRTGEIQQSLYIPGEYRRIAIRYRHRACRQPQKFLGHTLVGQIRRIR